MPYFLVTGDTNLTTKPKRLSAWHFRATATAVVNIRDASASGDIVVPINIATDTSAGQSYDTPAGGIVFPNGVFVQVVSGTVVGSVNLV